MNPSAASVVEILLVEDNPADVRLTQEALKGSKLRNRIHVVHDGQEALAFLRCEGHHAAAPEPHLILLDLNLPKKDGREVLEEIRGDPALTHLPVVVLTTSNAEADVMRSYRMHANAFVTKPVDMKQLQKVVQSIEEFWFTVVRLPIDAEEAE